MDGCYIPIQDAADLAGVSLTHMRRLIRNEQVKAVNEDKQVLVAWEDVKAFVTSQVPFWSLVTEEQLSRAESPSELLVARNLEDSRQKLSEFEINRVVVGDCRDWLGRMPLNSIQTVVTSPPYWGVRRYSGNQIIRWSDGTECALGNESTVEAYVRHSAEILRALRPVLRDDGTIWWNMGDTFQTRSYMRESSKERLYAIEGRIQSPTWKDYEAKRYSSGHSYLKDKDLTLAPFMVAIAAQHLGYYLRSVIVWSKENVGLDSAKDRPTPSHEYIFLLAKSRFYKYYVKRSQEEAALGAVVRTNEGQLAELSPTRKWRSVWEVGSHEADEPLIWTFATSNQHGDHVAAFPLELPLRCIEVSTDRGDLVFDPFMGSGTTGLAAKILHRDYFGCDISEEYVKEARLRIEGYNPPPLKAKQLELGEGLDIQNPGD